MISEHLIGIVDEHIVISLVSMGPAWIFNEGLRSTAAVSERYHSTLYIFLWVFYLACQIYHLIVGIYFSRRKYKDRICFACEYPKVLIFPPRVVMSASTLTYVYFIWNTCIPNIKYIDMDANVRHVGALIWAIYVTYIFGHSGTIFHHHFHLIPSMN